MVQPNDVNSAIGSHGSPTLGAEFVLILAYSLAPRIMCIGSSGLMSVSSISTPLRCWYLAIVSIYLGFGIVSKVSLSTLLRLVGRLKTPLMLETFSSD